MENKKPKTDIKVLQHEFRVMSIYLQLHRDDSPEAFLYILNMARRLMGYMNEKTPLHQQVLELSFLLCLIHVYKIENDSYKISLGEWREIVSKDILSRLEIGFCTFLWSFPDYNITEILIEKPQINS